MDKTPKVPVEKENPYNSGVLIGNWFEERFGDKNDKSAIAPGICGKSDCRETKSLYRKDFITLIDEDSAAECQDYLWMKELKFGNRLQSERSNIKIWDSDQFEKNLTTTTDVMHDIIPKKSAERGEFNILVKVPREDLLRSYGNYTTTGVRQWLACKQKKEKSIPADTSCYRSAFVQHPYNRNRVVCKADKKKTTIVYD